MEKAHESDEIYRTPTPSAPTDATWQQVQELEVGAITLHSLMLKLCQNYDVKKKEFIPLPICVIYVHFFNHIMQSHLNMEMHGTSYIEY